MTLAQPSLFPFDIVPKHVSVLTANVWPGDFLPHLLPVDGDPDGPPVPVHQEGDDHLETYGGCYGAQI